MTEEKLLTLDDIEFDTETIETWRQEIRQKLGVERIKKIEDRLKHTFDYEKITKRKAQIEILKEVFNLNNLKEKD